MVHRSAVSCKNKSLAKPAKGAEIHAFGCWNNGTHALGCWNSGRMEFWNGGDDPERHALGCWNNGRMEYWNGGDDAENWDEVAVYLGRLPPLFHCSSIPLFQYLNHPWFHDSNIPLFQNSNHPSLCVPCVLSARKNTFAPLRDEPNLGFWILRFR